MSNPAFGSNVSKPEVGHPANLADWIEDRVLPSVASFLTRQRLNAIAFVGFTLLILGLFGASFVKPWYNWDMSAYFAATMQHLEPSLSNEELHQRSWSLIEDFAPEREFSELTQLGEYRQHMYADPDDFVSMLPMYEVKKLYLAVGRWLTPIVGMKQAFYLQSALALLGVGLVLLYWMSRGGFLQAAPLVAGALLTVDFFKLGLYVTPDLPAAVFLIWGCERILAKRPWIGMALILISMGYRPDMILFVFAILLSSLVYRHLLAPASAGFAAAVVLYLFLTHGVQHPGWWTHFYFACVEIQNTLIGFHPDFSLVAYLKGVLRGVAIGLRDHDWWALLAVILFGWVLLAKSKIKLGRQSNQMLLACLLAIIGKFVLFPMPEDRFYLAILVVMVMILVERWSPQLSHSTCSSPRS
ncbi:hypothetical protein [uncultured Cohaesibacter sp.]|uniref:hypothetical protein n=1 Tax=uncultured Cohaesibacter sp. TaxID=1002546 RepID=UPI0029C7193F|nr:hypothetical protein [uncultured Cohaesibacter sp.]